MEEKSITHQESLDLIARMLRNTQNRFERGAGKPFLIWGYTTLAISLIVWHMLRTTGIAQWNLLWLAIPLIGCLCMVLLRKKTPPTAVTFIDRAIGQIWLVLGLCTLGASLFAGCFGAPFPILLVVSLLIFSGEAITGGVVKLGYIKIMGLIGMVLSFGLPFLTGINQILGFAGLFLIAMIIPGHIMNAQAKKATDLCSEN